MVRPRALSLVLCAVLVGCTSGATVTRGEGPTLTLAQAEPALGGKYRVAVGAIIDKTDPASERSLPQQLSRINAQRMVGQEMRPEAVTAGVQDLLITELFQSGRFIVLEREGLDAVITEQEFSQSTRSGDATRIPRGQLEGAELIVLGAITAFDAGVGGGALPIPVPLDDRGSFGILQLRMKRGYIAMDLRVIDARTGRVLSTVAVEGRNSRFGMDFSAYMRSRSSRVHLPNALTYFRNTPVEAALQDMVTAAVGSIEKDVALR
jgi:curli biogenesis system outer membrane secretion channel CsgG